jgi:hypothetical protein
MNKDQRNLYFGRLWPEACKVQKWTVKDNKKRREVTSEATGRESAADLDEDGITALFDHLRWLADPYSLEKAMPVANPELGWQANRRRQLVWRVESTAADAGLHEEYLSKSAEYKAALLRIKDWRLWPLDDLLKFAFTVKARAGSARKTAAKPLQSACNPAFIPTDDQPF